MVITLTYQPDKGIRIGDVLLFWDIDRQQVRTLLNGKFEIGDYVIDFGEDNNGDNSQNIIQRRDIYNNYKKQENYFFLNFDGNDRLIELELHYGLQISIENIVIDFSMDIEKVAEMLSSISSDRRILSEGEYFFKDLKLTIASSDSTGGDGKELSYFYCSKDVTHLLDN